jgi:hypothetical protein
MWGLEGSMMKGATPWLECDVSSMVGGVEMLRCWKDLEAPATIWLLNIQVKPQYPGTHTAQRVCLWCNPISLIAGATAYFDVAVSSLWAAVSKGRPSWLPQLCCKRTFPMETYIFSHIRNGICITENDECFVNLAHRINLVEKVCIATVFVLKKIT